MRQKLASRIGRNPMPAIIFHYIHIIQLLFVVVLASTWSREIKIFFSREDCERNSTPVASTPPASPAPIHLFRPFLLFRPLSPSRYRFCSFSTSGSRCFAHISPGLSGLGYHQLKSLFGSNLKLLTQLHHARHGPRAQAQPIDFRMLTRFHVSLYMQNCIYSQQLLCNAAIILPCEMCKIA